MQGIEQKPEEVLNKALDKARQKFLVRLHHQVIEIDRILDQIEKGAPIGPGLSEVGRNAHKVAGVAGTLGYAKLGELALAVDSECQTIDAGNSNAAIMIIEELIECADAILRDIKM